MNENISHLTYSMISWMFLSKAPLRGIKLLTLSIFAMINSVSYSHEQIYSSYIYIYIYL